MPLATLRGMVLLMLHMMLRLFVVVMLLVLVRSAIASEATFTLIPSRIPVWLPSRTSTRLQATMMMLLMCSLSVPVVVRVLLVHKRWHVIRSSTTRAHRVHVTTAAAAGLVSIVTTGRVVVHTAGTHHHASAVITAIAPAPPSTTTWTATPGRTMAKSVMLVKTGRPIPKIARPTIISAIITTVSVSSSTERSRATATSSVPIGRTSGTLPWRLIALHRRTGF